LRLAPIANDVIRQRSAWEFDGLKVSPSMLTPLIIGRLGYRSLGCRRQIGLPLGTCFEQVPEFILLGIGKALNGLKDFVHILANHLDSPICGAQSYHRTGSAHKKSPELLWAGLF
jgi:hypothetical protein